MLSSWFTPLHHRSAGTILDALIGEHSQQTIADPVWIIDICETQNGQCHLLEIGGISFADLYACDKAEIVKAVSAFALKQWQNDT